MPILWRYLLANFIKTTLTCVIAFIAILLAMRLDEIARFAALGAPLPYLFFFTCYQIPYILPIALPISCLIASMLLIQRLSHTHELTALRASGFGLFDILAPILLSAAFLSVLNFWMNSELATQSHLETNRLKSELRAINPLLLLHNKHLMRLKGFYFESLGSSHVGESASDVIFAIPNKTQQRLHLMIAKQLKTSPLTFIGEGISFITGTSGEQEEDFDNLLIENIQESQTHVQDFSHLLQKKVWTINNDYLQMPLLLARLHEQRQHLHELQTMSENPSEQKPLKSQIHRTLSEIIKRISIAAAVFSFTLMGTSLGMHIGRQRQYYPLYIAIALTLLFLISFFVAKGIDHLFWPAATLYIVPHLLIIAVAIGGLKRIIKGIE